MYGLVGIGVANRNPNQANNKIYELKYLKRIWVNTRMCKSNISTHGNGIHPLKYLNFLPLSLILKYKDSFL